jgi:hypothetical protein
MLPLIDPVSLAAMLCAVLVGNVITCSTCKANTMIGAEYSEK